MKSSRRLVALIALAVGAFGVLLSLSALTLELEETPGLQWLFRLRGAVAAPEEVIVIGISADSAEAFGLSSDLDEWPRSLHAELIERLDALGAALIVMDITFENPSQPTEDARLAEALADAGNVILLERVRSEDLALEGLHGRAVLERRIPPIEPLERSALATAPFTLPTVPIRTSQFWTFGRADTTMPNIPVVALQAYATPLHAELVALLDGAASGSGSSPPPAQATDLGIEAMARDTRLEFERRPELAARALERLDAEPRGARERELLRALIAMYSGPASRYLNYYGPTGTVETVPFHVALRAGSSAAPSAPDFEGKVVFVGFSERRQSEQQDAFISVYSERSGLNLSGVEIGATAFANLLEMSSIRPLSMPAHRALVFVWGLLITLALVNLRSLPAISASVALGAAYLGLAWYEFATANLWMPIIVPLGVQLPLALSAAVFWNYRRVHLQRERIRTALGYYVPDAVLSRLAQESFSVAERELVHGSCLVSDAEHFTSLSERLRPEELGELMEDYYAALSTVVERHGGFVADVSGDSMVAIWTAVQSSAAAKHDACLAALAILAAVEDFNRRHASQRLPTGLGLDAGELLLGNIGVAQRYQYRAVGDIVNTASRIQGLNRQLGTRLLLSEAALPAETGLATRELGRFLLVGKSTPVVIHEVLAVPVAAGDPRRTRFAEGLAAFRARRWAAAARVFEAIGNAVQGGDGPSRFYMEQCALLARQAPADDWSGTIHIKVK